MAESHRYILGFATVVDANIDLSRFLSVRVVTYIIFHEICTWICFTLYILVISSVYVKCVWFILRVTVSGAIVWSRSLYRHCNGITLIHMGKSIYSWTQQHHWNKNVVILTKFSSLAALEVVILTTSSAASDEHFIKMKTFPFQWYSGAWNLSIILGMYWIYTYVWCDIWCAYICLEDPIAMG